MSDSNSKSVFYGLMGTPFQSGLATSLFRMVDETLEQGHNVVVWCCGYGTMLSQTTVERRADIFDVETDGESANYPTTAELIQSLFRKAEGKLDWYVCDYCMKERGAVDHIDEVKVKIPFSYYHYLNQSDVSLVLGVKS